jgi:hypothetical protein
MATSPVVLLSNYTVDVTQTINANGSFQVYTGPDKGNTGGHNSIILTVQYKNIIPDPDTTSPGYKIRCQLQGQVDESLLGVGPADGWRVVGHQFDPYRFPFQGTTHVIEVQPNLFNPFPAVTVDVFDGSGVTERRSSQQGLLSDTFRIVFYVEETKYGTTNALQSFDVDVIGEKYNV